VKELQEITIKKSASSSDKSKPGTTRGRRVTGPLFRRTAGPPKMVFDTQEHPGVESPLSVMERGRFYFEMQIRRPHSSRFVREKKNSHP
jgi:hypothetical protein